MADWTKHFTGPHPQQNQAVDPDSDQAVAAAIRAKVQELNELLVRAGQRGLQVTVWNRPAPAGSKTNAPTLSVTIDRRL
jgi:hypothetical protein